MWTTIFEICFDHYSCKGLQCDPLDKLHLINVFPVKVLFLPLTDSDYIQKIMERIPKAKYYCVLLCPTKSHSRRSLTLKSSFCRKAILSLQSQPPFTQILCTKL